MKYDTHGVFKCEWMQCDRVVDSKEKIQCGFCNMIIGPCCEDEWTRCCICELLMCGFCRDNYKRQFNFDYGNQNDAACPDCLGHENSE